MAENVPAQRNELKTGVSLTRRLRRSFRKCCEWVKKYGYYEGIWDATPFMKRKELITKYELFKKTKVYHPPPAPSSMSRRQRKKMSLSLSPAQESSASFEPTNQLIPVYHDMKIEDWIDVLVQKELAKREIANLFTVPANQPRIKRQKLKPIEVKKWRTELDIMIEKINKASGPPQHFTTRPPVRI